MVRRLLRSFAIACLAAPLLGMGMLGGAGQTGLERNYEGTFVDRDGTRVDAKWVNAGGELALTGELGRGELRISFDNIKSIMFGGDASKALVAKVTLRKGETVEMRVRPSLTFSAQTELGHYQIRARDLQTVEFKGS
jgi:hypothetical protein